MLSTKDIFKTQGCKLIKSKKDEKNIPGKSKMSCSDSITSNETDFKTKIATKDKEEHFRITEVSIHQEDITIINKYIYI
jgi:hypothetical protein